jgi:PhnB protein
MAAKPIPEGYHTATPYLIVKNGKRALEFFFNDTATTEILRMEAPGDKIGHAEIKIGDSPIMLADEMPDMGYLSPETIGGTPVSVLLYVEDVDTRFKQALDAGATEMCGIKDQFYGDRSGTLKDPFGHVWTIATHTEDVTPEELCRRFEEALKQHA